MILTRLLKVLKKLSIFNLDTAITLDLRRKLTIMLVNDFFGYWTWSPDGGSWK